MSRMTEQPTEGKVFEKTLTAHVGVSAQAKMSVDRGLNDIRLAVLGILVAVGLAAATIPDVWSSQLLAGVGVFVFACFLVGWGRTRHYLMSFAHWLTGQ